MSNAGPVVAVTCLSFEARIAAGPGIHVLCGNAMQQASKLDSTMKLGGRGIISIGIAGGLDPGLAPGDWVVAAGVVTERERFPTDRSWSQRLLDALPGAIYADIAGVNSPVADPMAKRALRDANGTAAVDMESHIAAKVAAVHHVPFAACRVIIDPASRTVPPAALLGLRLDGMPDIGAMLHSLLRQPSQLLAFLRIVADARAAGAALLRGRRLIGANLGFPYVAEPGVELAHTEIISPVHP